MTEPTPPPTPEERVQYLLRGRSLAEHLARSDKLHMPALDRAEKNVKRLHDEDYLQARARSIAEKAIREAVPGIRSSWPEYKRLYAREIHGARQKVHDELKTAAHQSRVSARGEASEHHRTLDAAQQMALKKHDAATALLNLNPNSKAAMALASEAHELTQHIQRHRNDLQRRLQELDNIDLAVTQQKREPPPVQVGAQAEQSQPSEVEQMGMELAQTRSEAEQFAKSDKLDTQAIDMADELIERLYSEDYLQARARSIAEKTIREAVPGIRSSWPEYKRLYAVEILKARQKAHDQMRAAAHQARLEARSVANGHLQMLDSADQIALKKQEIAIGLQKMDANSKAAMALNWEVFELQRSIQRHRVYLTARIQQLDAVDLEAIKPEEPTAPD